MMNHELRFHLNLECLRNLLEQRAIWAWLANHLQVVVAWLAQRPEALTNPHG